MCLELHRINVTRLMENNRIVLSEVHQGKEQLSYAASLNNKYDVAVTTFPILRQTNNETTRDEEVVSESVAALDQSLNYSMQCAAVTDADGDLVVRRRRHTSVEVITIEHTFGTRLSDVGLQVWPGSLLLSDYILDNEKAFDGVVALELGGGVGLASITAARTARRVYCTDIGGDVLEMCRRNADTNKCLYKYRDQESDYQSVISVKELDWTQELLVCDGAKHRTSGFSWAQSDVECIEHAQFLLAADVIYDEYLTEALFRTIYRILLKPPKKTLLISMEKRLNFTLLDMKVSCPVYDHFLQCLQELKDYAKRANLQVVIEQLDSNIPQYFQYKRTPCLELWKITTSFEAE